MNVASDGVLCLLCLEFGQNSSVKGTHVSDHTESSGLRKGDRPLPTELFN